MNMVCFNHNTKFCSIQQPENSVMEGYYVLYHMWQFVRERDSLSNQFQVTKWAKELSQIPARGLTDMWARIQTELATVINMDVNNEADMFYGGSHS